MAAKKTAKKKKKDGRGRPTVMTPDIVSKLETGFSNDLTDLEACLYAGISRSTLVRYEEQNPEFRHRKELLKGALAVKAKNTVAKKINSGDFNAAKWWLETRRKNEFNRMVSLDHTNDGGPFILNLDVTDSQLVPSSKK